MRKMPFVLATASSLLYTSHAMASFWDEVTLIPSIAYQNKHIDFDQEYTAGKFAGRQSEFSTDIPTVNLTGTAVYDRFYLSYKFEKELTSATTGVDETPERGNQKYFLNTPAGDETDIEREDQSITFGYNAWQNLNVFVGYMKGKTTLSPDAMCPGICTTPMANLAYDHHVVNIGSYEQEYTEEGFFAGLSYGYRVSDIGTLSASIAYASMDGQYKDNYAALPAENFDFEGDSTGFSIGLTWSAPLTDRVGYFVDLRRQAYSMDAKDQTGHAQWLGSEVETDETMLSATAGIQLYF